MKNPFEPFVLLFFPRRCAYCGKVISASRMMCVKCEKELPRINGTTCIKCGREKDKCSCKGAEKYFVSLAAPFNFSGCVRNGIHAFKFRKGLRNYQSYSSEMARTVKQKFAGIDFDYITEVPMTDKSIKQRGYNQCSWLAEGISEKLNLEHKSDVLKKCYETKKQHGLNYYLRKGNLTGVFEVSTPEDVEGKTILLCDDISTSGETLNECSKMLWLHGAKEIYCITVALTVHRKKNDNS